jgi:hypothetical protein
VDHSNIEQYCLVSTFIIISLEENIDILLLVSTAQGPVHLSLANCQYNKLKQSLCFVSLGIALVFTLPRGFTWALLWCATSLFVILKSNHRKWWFYLYYRVFRNHQTKMLRKMFMYTNIVTHAKGKCCKRSKWASNEQFMFTWTSSFLNSVLICWIYLFACWRWLKFKRKHIISYVYSHHNSPPSMYLAMKLPIHSITFV